MNFTEEYGSSSASAIANASPAFMRFCRAGSRFSFSTTSFLLERCIAHRTSIRSFHTASLDRTSSVGDSPKDELPRVVGGDPRGLSFRLRVAQRHPGAPIFFYQGQKIFLEGLPFLLVPHLVVEPHGIHGAYASSRYGSCGVRRCQTVAS